MQKGGLWERGIFKDNGKSFPLVTIVTVTFNAEEYLSQALQSIVNQTYLNVELLVIDGGSTDRTLDIIRQFEGHIDFWQSEPDKGIYDAMNKGLALARGEWIGFKNADDWYVLEAVDILVRTAQTVAADVFYGNSFSVINEYPLHVAPFFTDHRTLGANPGIDHRSSFVRTALHQEVSFDLQYRLAADLDVFWRLKRYGATFHHMKEFIAYKRYGGASDGSEILKESFAINRKNMGAFLAVYLRLKTNSRYYTWRMMNWILLALLGRNGYNRFKSRKIRQI